MFATLNNTQYNNNKWARNKNVKKYVTEKDILWKLIINVSKYMAAIK